jgi:hypothetical protein
MSEKRLESTTSKMIKVCLWLRVWRNNKHVQGRRNARDEIERLVLSCDRMEKPRANGWVYLLSIPYRPMKNSTRSSTTLFAARRTRSPRAGTVSSKPTIMRCTISTDGGEPPRHRRIESTASGTLEAK